jgi:hypothetical protein
MNSYELSRIFFDWSYENPEKVNPNHIALYFFIIEHNNRLGWKPKFGLPMQMAMDAIGIKNYRTWANTFNDLVNYGFIEVFQKSKNQYSANIIGIVKNTKSTTKALSKATQNHNQKHSQSQVHDIVGIDKPINLIPNNQITYLEIKKIYEGSKYETQSDLIKGKYEKYKFDAYLKFVNLFKRHEEKIKFHEFPLLDEFVEDLFSKYTLAQIETGITKMFGYKVDKGIHLVSRIITCMGFGNNGKVEIKKQITEKENIPKKEWWQTKYGDRFKTYEEFEEARLAGIIDPFND